MNIQIIDIAKRDAGEFRIDSETRRVEWTEIFWNASRQAPEVKDGLCASDR